MRWSLTAIVAMAFLLPSISVSFQCFMGFMDFEKSVELGESAGPAFVVAVTRGLVVKLLVQKNQFGAGADGPQAHADARHRSGVLCQPQLNTSFWLGTTSW